MAVSTSHASPQWWSHRCTAGRPGGKTMPTIYEVAAQAGVSPATVSRVFNGQQRLGREGQAGARRRAVAWASRPTGRPARCACRTPRSSRWSSPTSRTRSSPRWPAASRTSPRRPATRSCSATPTRTRPRRRNTWTSRWAPTWPASSWPRPATTATWTRSSGVSGRSSRSTAARTATTSTRSPSTTAPAAWRPRRRWPTRGSGGSRASPGRATSRPRRSAPTAGATRSPPAASTAATST